MKRSHLTATTIAVLGMASTSIAGVVPTFASWTDAGNGSLNGVNFTVVPTAGSWDTPSIQNGDFSAGNAWDSAGSLDHLNYRTGDNWTITFDSAVSGLSLYTYYWRGTATSGSEQTLSEAFTTNANFSGSTSGNTLNATGFNSGILSFSGPVTTLTVTGGVGTNGYQGLTLAQTAGSQAVPGIGGIAAIAGVGLVGRRRRR